MTRSTFCIVSMSLMALTTASGTALAQSRSEAPQNFVRLADRSAEMKTSLAEAISIAEKHSKGVVIGIRLSTNRDAFLTEANGMRQTGDGTWGQPAPDRNESGAVVPSAERGVTVPNTRATSTPQTPATPMFAIVTCVIDRARIRDMVIDMSTGTVLGMQSMNASAQGNRGEYQNGMYVDQSRFSLVRASDLMNATVQSADGQRVGDIDELVINPDSNHIVYGVLRRGGFLGLNESRYAVAASELSVPKDGIILLNLSNSDFEGHSGFAADKWPTQADSEWTTSWNQSTEQAPDATRILKATELIGTTVECSDGQKVGEISDLIVEPRSGQVVYAIVGADRGEIVVPMSIVHAHGERRIMKMTHAEVLALPVLGDKTEPDWNDARWNRRIHDTYKAEMDLSADASGGR